MRSPIVSAGRRWSLLAAVTMLALGSVSAVRAAPPQVTHEDQLGSDDGVSKPDYYRYVDRAYPSLSISPVQSEAARAAFDALTPGAPQAWSELTYKRAAVPGPVTYTGLGFTASGRITALQLTPGCASASSGPCRGVLGAAGGGIWIADNPFSGNPQWVSHSTGLRSNAIGAIAVDPNGAGMVIYAGTGEQNLSGDSEAGVGLYKSIDGGQTWTVLHASVHFAEGLSVSSIAVDPRDGTHIYFSTSPAFHGAASSAISGATLAPGTAPAGIYESHDAGASFTRIYTSTSVFTGSVLQIGLDPTDLDTVYASLLGVGIVRRSAALDGDTAFHVVYATRSPVGTANDGFNRLAFALAQRPYTTRVYVADTIDADQSAYLYRVDNARVPASTLSDGVNDAGWRALSSPTPGKPGFSSYDLCEGQCFYDIWLASPQGLPDEVWYGGSMQYDEIFNANPPSNGRAVMRSTNAGVSFTDMTRDAQSPSSAGMHPDQHAYAFNPMQPEQLLAASDGGLVRTSGSFVDATQQCSGRQLTGADLTDCQIWLAAIPTRITAVNQGLETLQYQDVEFNPSRPDTEFLGGTQDNGSWYGGTNQPVFIETVGGDGGLAGYDAIHPDIRFHTYYGPQMDVNFRAQDTLGWNYIADPLGASGEATEFYMSAINDPVVGGTIFAGLQHVWRTQDSGGQRAYLEQHCNEYTGDFTVTCGDFVALGEDLTGSIFGTDLTGGDVTMMLRWTGDRANLWVATNKGRLFFTTNANATNPADVRFVRIDNASSPVRVVSGIARDLADSYHAFVAYTGYSAYTPSTPGHVFDVHAVPGGASTFTDVSYNLGDLPVTGLVRDDATGNLYAATDFGVLVLPAGKQSWVRAGRNLPYVAVYQLKMSPDGLVYAATHGRGIWTLQTR